MIINKSWGVLFKKFIKGFLLFYFLLVASPTYSIEKIYKVGVEELEYYPLFNFSANDSNQPSFTRELLSTFFTQYNIKFQFVVLPIKRFDKWYAEHGIDFKFPDNVRWRTDNKNTELGLTFSNPVVYLNAGTYVLRKNKNIMRDEIKTLGTVAGFYPTLWVDRISKNETTLLESNSPISVVKHVLYENSQATNIEKNVIDYHLKLLGKEGEIVMAKNIKHEKFAYHLSSIHYPEIIIKFNEFLQKNRKFVKQLKEKYHIIEP